jgi:hypothetical protein
MSNDTAGRAHREEHRTNSSLQQRAQESARSRSTPLADVAAADVTRSPDPSHAEQQQRSQPVDWRDPAGKNRAGSYDREKKSSFPNGRTQYSGCAVVMRRLLKAGHRSISQTGCRPGRPVAKRSAREAAPGSRRGRRARSNARRPPRIHDSHRDRGVTLRSASSDEHPPKPGESARESP